MASDENIRTGILRTRDLVENDQEARVAVSIIENAFSLADGLTHQILKLDPRRIRYEIVLSNGGNATDFLLVGSKTPVDLGNALEYKLLAGTTAVIVRDFKTDLDAVVIDVWAANNQQPFTVTVRETFLTPLPVDETP